MSILVAPEEIRTEDRTEEEFRYEDEPRMFFRGRKISLTSWPTNSIPGNEPFEADWAPPSFIDWLASREYNIRRPQDSDEIAFEFHSPDLNGEEYSSVLMAWEFLAQLTFHHIPILEVELVADLLAAGVRSMLNELADTPEAAEFFRNTVIQALSDEEEMPCLL